MLSSIHDLVSPTVGRQKPSYQRETDPYTALVTNETNAR